MAEEQEEYFGLIRMAIVAFDLKDFEVTGLDQDKIVETMERIGIEIEERKGSEIKVNVTPNRPDLLDFTGMLRAIEDFAGKRTPKEDFYVIKEEPVLTIEVKSEVKKIRPYIAGMVVKNVDLSGNKLKYLINFTEKFADTYGRKRRKLAIGVHNLDEISGNLTYTASAGKSFVPLNSTASMSFNEIMENHEKGVAYREAILDYGKKSVMFPMLSDSEKIIAMIPITNSEATKVTEKTKDIFIDITGTSLATIRSAAGLLACSFIFAGATVEPVTVEYESGAEVTPSLEYKEIKVSMRNADRTLGIETGKHNVIALANKMGYNAAKYSNSVLFYVPPYRVDVLNDQDVIEDMAIAYGYDKIMPLGIMGFADGLSNDVVDYENVLASLMVGLGYTEAINSTLTNEKLNFDSVLKPYEQNSYVSIADAKTSTITMLRTSLLPGLLQNLSDSRNERMPQRIFEIGRVFSFENNGIKESIRLCLLSEHSKANLSEMRSIVDTLMRFMGVSYKVTPSKSEANIEGRVASVVVNNETVGTFGELHPKVLSNFGLEEPVVAASITIIKEVKYEA